MKEWNRERHVYVFNCAGCGKKKAQSYRRKVARTTRCRKCRKGLDLNPAQITLHAALDDRQQAPTP